jgi:hypothetical protein
VICLNEWLATAEPHDYCDYCDYCAAATTSFHLFFSANLWSAKLPRQKLKWQSSARAVDPEPTVDVIAADEGIHQNGQRETVGWDYYGVFSQWDRCLRYGSAIGISRSEVTAGCVVGVCPSRWLMMEARRDFRPTKVTLDICSFMVPARAVGAH